MLADKCLELLGKDERKRTVGEYVVADARAKAVKGLVELVCGNLGSGTSKATAEFVVSLYNY